MAVNAEHEKNIDNDAWRQYQLLKSTTNPNHPYNKFSTGNVTTLRDAPLAMGIDVHAELLRFYSQNYVSTNMRLVVLGNDTLDVLETMAAEMFVQVPNPAPFVPAGRPSLYLPGGNLGKYYLITPVSDLDELAIFWPLPAVLEDLLSNPIGGYISLLLGYEGSGSLLAALKVQGFATGLSAGLSEDDTDFAFMSVFIALTPAGVQQRDHVVSLVYGYLKLLGSTPPQQWIYDENKQVDEVGWLFPDEPRPSSLVSSLASFLHVTIDPTEILLEPNRTLFNPSLISGLLQALTPLNSVVFVTSKSLALPQPMYEHWYGTAYSSSHFTQAQITLWTAQADPAQFALPPPNPYLVTDTTIIAPPPSSVSPFPILVNTTASPVVWFKWGTFGTPKATIRIHLISNRVFESAASYVAATLYLNGVIDAVTDVRYQASVVGLSVSFGVTRSGIDLSFYGFSEKLPSLAYTVIDALAKGSLIQDNFSLIVDELNSTLNQALFTDAWQQAK